MANRITPVGKAIIEYREKYPHLKDYTLARLVAEERPELWPNSTLEEATEKARFVVRYYKGSAGEVSRVKSENRGREIQPLTHDTRNMDLDIRSYRKPLQTFSLPQTSKEVLFLSDIHIPYQDNDSLGIALDYGVRNKVDTIWLNGDIIDCYMASAHEKFPDKAALREEFEIAEAFFAHLRKRFPGAKIYWLEGNHERRWKRMIARKAPELWGDEYFSIEGRLGLKEKGILWIDNGTLCKFGKLNVIHGNEFKGGGGVNTARTLYLKAKTSTIAGDKHRTAENTEGDLNGKIITTWGVGCLCELNPEYMPFAHTSWNLGFAHISLHGKGEFSVRNFRIHNGKIL